MKKEPEINLKKSAMEKFREQRRFEEQIKKRAQIEKEAQNDQKSIKIALAILLGLFTTVYILNQII